MIDDGLLEQFLKSYIFIAWDVYMNKTNSRNSDVVKKTIEVILYSHDQLFKISMGWRSHLVALGGHLKQQIKVLTAV